MSDHPSHDHDCADAERRVAFAMLARVAHQHPDWVTALLADHDPLRAVDLLDLATGVDIDEIRDSAREDLALAAENGARLITPDDHTDWPRKQFAALTATGATAPIALWARGNTPLSTFTSHGVAVIGTRSPTAYGHHVAAEFADGLAHRGYPIITGADIGIAATAHTLALHQQTPVLAVTPARIDAPYPAPAPGPDLITPTAEHGLVISLHAPYSHPRSDPLPARNQLIAALASAVLLPESGPFGQVRHTIDTARALYRRIFAVPAPATIPSGTNTLIRTGRATLVSHPDQVHAFLRTAPPSAPTTAAPAS